MSKNRIETSRGRSLRAKSHPRGCIRTDSAGRKWIVSSDVVGDKAWVRYRGQCRSYDDGGCCILL